MTKSAKSFCRQRSTRASPPPSTASASPVKPSRTSNRSRTRMDIGFIGLGNMGFPIASRILAAGHPVVVFDTQPDVVDRAVTLGARAATSPKDVADRTDAVMASLPSLQASADVAIGPNGVIDGRRARRFIDLSTIGSQVAQHNHACLSERGFATLDAPVSGGVNGARNGTLAVMVSGPRSDVDAMLPV